MASASKVPDSNKICINCRVYGWKQPENLTTVKRCTKCYMVSYCGKDCQVEHWHKVHKNHCKFLSGRKKGEDSEHNLETCKTCIAFRSAGVSVHKPTNPTYFCIFLLKDWSWNKIPSQYPHPFPFTGLPGDRFEKMVTVAQKILLKIKMTEDLPYMLDNQVDEIGQRLWSLRGLLYGLRLYGVTYDHMPILDKLRITFFDPTSPWQVLQNACSRLYRGDYLLLRSFEIVKNLMISTNEVQFESSLKSLDSLPKDVRQMSKKDQFFEVADKIIEALDKEVVPHQVLATIACKGKTKQNCSQCHKEVVVQSILTSYFTAKGPAVVVNPLQTKRFVCEKPECIKKEQESISAKEKSWYMPVLITYTKLSQTRCDYCFLLAPLKEVHRSKCLTKNYCSQSCRNADDAVHAVCCAPDEEHRLVDPRKVKLGGHKKNAAADAHMDDLFKDFEDCADLPKSDKTKITNIIKNSKTKRKKANKNQGAD